MSGQEVATRSPARELVSQIRSEQFKQQVAIALPGNVTPERFQRAVVTAVMQNPDLANAETDSIFTSAIRCATDGLLPDGREAAFVIFGRKAVYMPMVGGFRKIAAEHGWTIRSAVVYEADEFEYELGLDTRLVHRPAPLRVERGRMIAAYAVATHLDGRKEFEVMTAAEIEKVRQSSRSKDSGPWRDWPERMWEKTPARRLFAKLPLDKRDDRVERMLEASRENPAELLYGPDGHAHPVTPALTQGDAPAVAAPEEGGAADPGEPKAPGSQQGGQQAGPADGTETSAAAPAPGDDDPEPQIGQQTTFEIPAAVIDEAAATKITKGEFGKGMSLAEIAATADGPDWLLWALRKTGSYWSVTFRERLELFVEHRAPDVWERYMAEKTEAA